MVYISAAGQSTAKLIQQNGFSGSVPDSLRYIATTFHLPLIAECYDDSKSRITIPSGQLNGDVALGAVTRTAHLQSKKRGDVWYVFDSDLARDRRNQLNHRFPTFDVPRDADTFLMILISRLHNDAHKAPGDASTGGFVISGIPNDKLKNKLQEEKVKSIAARDLLLHAASGNSFWAVVSYPYPPPEKRTPETENEFPVEGHWAWGDVPVAP